MWRLTPVEAGHPHGELKGIVDQLPQPEQEVPNFIRLLTKSPAALTAYSRAEAALTHGQLAPQQRELIALAVAEINGSDYCLATHEQGAKEAGLSEDEIKSARMASANDPKNDALLHFVQALVLQRGEVSDDDFSATRKAGFSEAEIIEVLANVVLNIFTNYFNLLARTDLDLPLSPANEHDRSAGKTFLEGLL